MRRLLHFVLFFTGVATASAWFGPAAADGQGGGASDLEGLVAVEGQYGFNARAIGAGQGRFIRAVPVERVLRIVAGSYCGLRACGIRLPGRSTFVFVARIVAGGEGNAE